VSSEKEQGEERRHGSRRKQQGRLSFACLRKGLGWQPQPHSHTATANGQRAAHMNDETSWLFTAFSRRGMVVSLVPCVPADAAQTNRTEAMQCERAERAGPERTSGHQASPLTPSKQHLSVSGGVPVASPLRLQPIGRVFVCSEKTTFL